MDCGAINLQNNIHSVKLVFFGFVSSLKVYFVILTCYFYDSSEDQQNKLISNFQSIWRFCKKYFAHRPKHY